jgi:site-specific DNA-methyltransferase (cytosine-N4-specific)
VTATLHIGDVRDVLATFPADSVDCVITSPPYLALRSYLPADHPDKARELGSEATPGEFIDNALDYTEALRRVLAPHGTLCLELGDTYAGSGGAGGDYNEGGSRAGQPVFRHNAGPGWPLDRSMCLVPQLYQVALVYGFNPLTGRQTQPWRVRNVVFHFRPNPPVGAPGGKFRPATSHWTVAVAGERRWFDIDSVRTTGSPNTHARTAAGVDSRPNTSKTSPDGNRDTLAIIDGNGSTPPLDWWDDDDLEWRDAAGFVQSTQGYPGAHYATFSKRVVKRLIDPQCPRRVCRECGTPSRRITETAYEAHGDPVKQNGEQKASADFLGQQRRRNAQGMEHGRADKLTTTLGWTSCGCPGTDGLRLDGFHTGPGWRPGVVLDPFAGSGTTLQVATGMSRDAIGIELDPRNVELVRERCGMFLDAVVNHDAQPQLDGYTNERPAV